MTRDLGLDAFQAALERAGLKLTHDEAQEALDARTPQMVIMLAEAYAYHEATLRTRPEDFGAVLRTRLREASVLSAADYGGFTSGGLPIGLQIAGRAFDERTVLRVAGGYQHATDWHLRAPALAAHERSEVSAPPSIRKTG